MPEISQRKLDSYIRAEKIAREVRFQISACHRRNENRLAELTIHWLKTAGKNKYQRPD